MVSAFCVLSVVLDPPTPPGPSSGHDFKFSYLWSSLYFIHPFKGAVSFSLSPGGITRPSGRIDLPGQCFSQRILCTGKFWAFLEEYYVIITTTITTPPSYHPQEFDQGESCVSHMWAWLTSSLELGLTGWAGRSFCFSQEDNFTVSLVQLFKNN